jgi:prevent-host-death family protein
MVIEKYIPISSAKAKLLTLLRQIEEEHEHVILTKNGLPKAVLLNYDDFAGLLETLDILTDAETLHGITAGLQDVKAGRVVSLEEALKA